MFLLIWNFLMLMWSFFTASVDSLVVDVDENFLMKHYV